MGSCLKNLPQWFVLLTFSFLCGSLFAQRNDSSEDIVNIPDEELTIEEIIVKYGYEVEIHEVETEDGYILKAQRVLPSSREYKKTPVLIMHGLMGSAENFIIAGPNKALPYLLADKGYEVWLGNARGTMHSRRHKRFDPDQDSEFWKFSWHEIGIYDLPAFIDYVLNETKSEQVIYAGHSQGTTSFFVMASERPEYQDKVKLGVMMAPAVFMKHMNHPLLKMVSQFYPLLDNLAISLNAYELVPFINNNLIRFLGRSLCNSERKAITDVCFNIILFIAGYDEQLDETKIPLITATSPAGAATRQALHYAQSIVHGRFRQYDFGGTENLKKYDSVIPPDYTLNVRTPIGLYFSEGDTLQNHKDIINLSKILPNVVHVYKVDDPDFTHFDFIWAKDIVPLLHENILELIDQYGNEIKT